MRPHLRHIANSDKSLQGPLSVLRSDLDSDGAGDGVVTGRKPAHANHVLESFPLHDIANLFAIEGRFRERNEHNITSAKHSDEFVVNGHGRCCLVSRFFSKE